MGSERYSREQPMILCQPPACCWSQCDQVLTDISVYEGLHVESQVHVHSSVHEQSQALGRTHGIALKECNIWKGLSRATRASQLWGRDFQENAVLACSVLPLAGHIGSGPAMQLSGFSLFHFSFPRMSQGRKLSGLTRVGEPFMLT